MIYQIRGEHDNHYTTDTIRHDNHYTTDTIRRDNRYTTDTIRHDNRYTTDAIRHNTTEILSKPGHDKMLLNIYDRFIVFNV